MTLLSSANPERVDLVGGLTDNPNTPNIETALEVGRATIHWYSQDGIAISAYPALQSPFAEAPTRNLRAKFDANAVMVSQAARGRDFLWLTFKGNFHRHAVKDSGAVFDADVVLDASRLKYNGQPLEYVTGRTILQGAPQFKIDGTVLYVLTSGMIARAFRLDEFLIRGGTTDLERIPELDVSLLDGIPAITGNAAVELEPPRVSFLNTKTQTRLLDFDIKTVGEQRYVLTTTYDDAEYTRGGTEVDVRIGVRENGNLIIRDLIGDTGISPGTQSRTHFNYGGINVVYDTSHVLSEAPLIVISSTHATGIGSVTYDMALQFRDGEGNFAAYRPVQQTSSQLYSLPAGSMCVVADNRIALTPAPIGSKDVLAQRIGQSAERLTEASNSEFIFRERKEVAMQVRLSNVNPEFLVRTDWHFILRGRVYTMLSFASTEEGDVIANMAVV